MKHINQTILYCIVFLLTLFLAIPVNAAQQQQQQPLQIKQPIQQRQLFVDAPGTVRDSTTGLIWLKNANCSLFGKMTWDQAMVAVQSLKSGICGLKDGSTAGQWRLPTIDELKQRYKNPQGFDNFQTDGYWSSSTVAGTNDFAWGFGMHFGQMNGNQKNSLGFVWPVRSGK